MSWRALSGLMVEEVYGLSGRGVCVLRIPCFYMTIQKAGSRVFRHSQGPDTRRIYGHFCVMELARDNWEELR